MALTKRNLQELKQAKNLGIHILKKQQAWVNAELDPDKIKNTNTSIYENWHVFTNIRPGAVRHNAEWYLAVRDKQTGQIKYSEYLSQKKCWTSCIKSSQLATIATSIYQIGIVNNY